MKTKRILALLLSVILILALLPSAALAANVGSYTLDLTGGSATPSVAEGECVIQTLNIAFDHGLCGRTLDTTDMFKPVAKYDLDKNGSNDLVVTITRSSKGSHQTLKTEFVVPSTASVFGDKTSNLTYTGSEDYYSPLTLKFPAAPTITVTFFENGGTGTMAPVTTEKDQPYSLPECTFTPPEGKEFDKWDQGAPGESVTFSSDVTIVALWKDKDTAPKEIENIKIDSINTDLKIGQKPTFAATLSAESAAMAIIKEEHWIDETDNKLLSSDGTEWTITEGHTYSYGITLEAKEGYVFTNITGLEYDGISWAQSAIGSTLKADGSGLELWDFMHEIDVIGDSVDKLVVDLTKGGVIVPEPRCTALHNTLIAATEAGQTDYSPAGVVDLDKDGTMDFSFDKTSGVIKLQSSMSLTEDCTLTLSDEGVIKAATPYAKTVEFKMAPASKACDLNLYDGKVTLSGDDADALVFTLQTLNGKSITLETGVNYWDADLDMDGSKDLHVTESGADVIAEALETSSVADKIVLDIPLYDVIPQAGSSLPYLTQLTVRFAAPEPAKDLGTLTVDLSGEAPAPLTESELAAFQASMGGLNFTHKVKTKTEGDVMNIDLDNDGVYDVKVEKQTDGTGVFTVLENCSVTDQVKLTLGDPEITAVNALEKEEYYGEITVIVTGGTGAKDLGAMSLDLTQEPPVTVTNPELLAFRGSMSGLEAAGVVVSKTEGDIISIDLDKNGVFDIAVNGACEFSVLEGCSVAGETKLTLDAAAIAAIDSTYFPEYYGTITVKLPGVATPPANPFVDVAADAYYYAPVLWAYSHTPQITNGTDETHFSPEATCTRGQVVTFLWRSAGCPAPTSSTMPFADVASDAYYYEAVLWAVEKNITKGTSETTFSPDAYCTRAQVVTFLWRSSGEPAASGTNVFADVSADAYYYAPVLWAVEKSITNGTDATHFSPDNSCTRGQIVTFLYRAMK
ncbi:MAG: S-layer homology domain-containing protein [Oscillospiraceae bacterium]|nr:S-layer homology domain-containing protein [Oscillospiraceae bacterium]